MNKKEISEIRRILSKDHCRIDRIGGCYVAADDNGNRQIVMEMQESFLSLPEEDMHKYCAIFRKTLSGTVGKHLMTLEFPLAEEAPDGRQAQLLALRDAVLEGRDGVSGDSGLAGGDSGLAGGDSGMAGADDDIRGFGQDGKISLLRRYSEEIMSCYPAEGNFLILFAFGRYDVPARTSDRNTLEDASDYVYSFMVCSICPVALSKAGLCYSPEQHSFISKLQDHMVGMPAAGFLFPAFEDRNTDIHNVLYYTSKPAELHEPFLTGMLGIEPPLTAETQQTTFHAIIEETLQRDCDFEVAKTVHEKLSEMTAESADDPEPPVLDQHAVRVILSECGASDEQLASFDSVYEELAGDEELMVSNVYAARKFEVTAPDVKVTLSADRTDLIETRIIDGQECLVIPLSGDVEVNGMRIRGKRQTRDAETQVAE